MKKKVIKVPLILVLFWISHSGFAQSTLWYFGQKAGLQFSPPSSTISVTNPAVPAFNTSEGTAVATDDNGNLLFYTDGHFIYNSAHLIVQDPLTALNFELPGHGSSTQAALIIPVPETDCHRYFIFTNDCAENAKLQTSKGFQVCLIDVNGSVITIIERPTLMYALKYPVAGVSSVVKVNSEKIASTSDTKGGQWVVHHLAGNIIDHSNCFYIYHVTKDITTIADLKNTLKITNSGYPHLFSTIVGANGTSGYALQGQMKISKNGKYIGMAVPDISSADPNANFVEVLKFDNINGQVGAPIITIPRFTIHSTLPQTHTANLYGFEFSGLNRYFFVSEGYCQGSNIKGNIYKFDLLASNILTSITVPGTTSHLLSTFNCHYPYGALQLGADNHVYAARPDRNFVSAIVNPDNTPVPSVYQDVFVSLTSGTLSKLGLPTTTFGRNCTPGNQCCPLEFSMNTDIHGNHYIQYVLNSSIPPFTKIKLSVESISFLGRNCNNATLSYKFHDVDDIFLGYGKYINSNSVEWFPYGMPQSFPGTMVNAPITFYGTEWCQCIELCIKIEIETEDCKKFECRKCFRINCEDNNEDEIESPNGSNDDTKLIPKHSYRKLMGNNNSLTVYPNPSNNAFNINHNLEGKLFDITIIDQTGKVVFSKSISNEEKSIENPGLVMGFYLIKITNESGKSLTTKLLRN